MQRFREWREALKSKAEAALKEHTSSSNSSSSNSGNSASNHPTENSSATPSASTSYDRRASEEVGRMDSMDKSHASLTPNLLGSVESAPGSDAPAATASGQLSFAEIDRMRRERHAIFVQILADPDTFAAFLRFLPASQQHELLFVCEVNQLLEKSSEWDEAEIIIQAIKIANIFLRNADAATQGASSSSTGSNATSGDPDASVLQVASIQPATRRHLQSCIPLTLPPYLHPPGAPAADAQAAAAAREVTPMSARSDTKVILSMLEVSRDQVEESISKKSLSRFLELLNNPDGASKASAANSINDEQGLIWEYQYEDCVASVAGSEEESVAFAYVFRAFLLYLMEDKRHRILCFWADVQRALVAVKDAEVEHDANGSSSNHLQPSASNDELHHASKNDNEPHSAPPVAISTPTNGNASRVSSHKLTHLYNLYTQLEDAFHRFYPDTPLRSPNFFMSEDELSLGTLANENDGSDADERNDMAIGLLSPTSPQRSSTLNQSFVSPPPAAVENASSTALNPSSSSPLDPVAEMSHEIDSHATAAQIRSLLDNMRTLIARLRPMCAKMDKILRYTFWPQFMKSEQYHQLSKIKRPVVKKKTNINGNNALLPSPSPTPSPTSPTAVKPAAVVASAAPTPKVVSQAQLDRDRRRQKQALVSSLKQQKVCREMLVFECASEAEVRARFEKGVFGQTGVGGPNRGGERERLLEYVTVVKSTPNLPPRPQPQRSPMNRTPVSATAAATTPAVVGSPAAGSASAANVAGYSPSSGPPLPPRPAGANNAAAAAAAVTAAALISGRTKSNSAADPSASNPSSAANSGVIRGSQCLSLLYRYPHTNHASSALPAHLYDLAFPSIVDTANEGICQCVAHASPPMVCVKDSTKPDLNGTNETAVTTTASASPVVTKGSSSASPSRSASNADDGSFSDFYGFTVTQSVIAQTPTMALSPPSASSRAAAAAIASVTASTVPKTRLFNIVCTQEDGSVLHGCVLQLSQSELIEDKWEEVEYDESVATATPGYSASASPPAVNVPAGAIATVGSGIGADVLSQTAATRKSSTDPIQGSSLASYYAQAPSANTDAVTTPVRPTVSSTLAAASAPSISRANRGGATKVTQHHRVYRAQVSYAIVILTKHPLFNLLREALRTFVDKVINPHGSNAASFSRWQSLPMQEFEDMDLAEIRKSFPLGQLKGFMTEVFDSTPFYRLLSYTRIPTHSLDLFGLGVHAPTPSYLSVPPLDFSFELLFRCLHPRRLLIVVEGLLTERKVLLISSQNSMLTLAAQCFLTLLYPFSWKYLYVPILPFALFKYLACPTPFLIGIHSCFKRKARELIERDVIIVDLDHDEVFVPPMNSNSSGSSEEGPASSPTSAASNPDASHLPYAVREQLLSVAARLFLSDVVQLDAESDSSVHATASLLAQSSQATLDDSVFPPLRNEILTPQKPAVDSESGKIIDPYSGAEAPLSIRTTSDSFNNANQLFSSPSSVLSPDSTVQISPSSLATTRSLLLQLEFIKLWSHLLKHFRAYVIQLSIGSGTSPILLFDTPSFLATKPQHYQAFLTTLLNSSYFPVFLYERSGPGGLLPVERDAFDRYEASLSGTRIQIWQAAYAYKRKVARLVKEAARSTNGSLALAPAYSLSKRQAFTRWIELYQASGIDPSLHHIEYLSGWNCETNAKWPQVERLPRGWWKQQSTAAANVTATSDAEIPPSATTDKSRESRAAILMGQNLLNESIQSARRASQATNPNSAPLPPPSFAENSIATSTILPSSHSTVDGEETVSLTRRKSSRSQRNSRSNSRSQNNSRSSSQERANVAANSVSTGLRVDPTDESDEPEPPAPSVQPFPAALASSGASTLLQLPTGSPSPDSPLTPTAPSPPPFPTQLASNDQ